MRVRAVENRSPIRDWWSYSQGLRLRHRLAVLAPDAQDVVTQAGGWLFDRAQAGWEVAVALADVGDIAPLQLLGATVLELEGPLSVPVHHTWPELLIVAPALLAADERVRGGVRECLERDLLDIVVWDQELPAGFDRWFAGAHCHPSAAARAFKACALALGGYPGAGSAPIERFRAAGARIDAVAGSFALGPGECAAC
ncbi:hypothetical protein AB0H71_03230 [Nocardia sp. NPDC050697]|uniref:hypothetical protein n=1 Tax=Nocardia sp. NPDC050697 TaxID=3155158 RepID=UPI0033E24D43